MYNAEVLSKFPVVQHFPFGSLFSWDKDPDAAAPVQSVHMANQPIATAATAGMTPPQVAGAGTAAPWAQATRMPGPSRPGIPYSRVPAVAPGGGTGVVPAAVRQPRQGVAPARDQGQPGAGGAQMALTKAPWAKD